MENYDGRHRGLGVADLMASDLVAAPGSDFLMDACRKAALQEWEVLDGYLGRTLDAWGPLAEHWDLRTQARRESSWKTLALPISASHLVVSRLQGVARDSADELCMSWMGSPIIMMGRTHEIAGVVTVTAAHPCLAEEVKAMHHPEIGTELKLEQDCSLDEFHSNLAEALSLIGQHSERGREAVSAGLSYLAVLEKPPGLKEGGCISFTSRSAPGVVFLTPMPPILLAESIVHEAVHGVLYAATRIARVHAEHPGLLESPLRPDPRPAEGLVHQALVLSYLADFFEGLSNSEDNDRVTRNAKQIEKRLHQHRSDLEQALATLDANGEMLTELGKSLVARIKKKYTSQGT